MSRYGHLHFVLLQIILEYALQLEWQRILNPSVRKQVSRMAELDGFSQLELLMDAERDLEDCMVSQILLYLAKIHVNQGQIQGIVRVRMDYALTAGYSTVDLFIQSWFLLQ